MRVSDIRRQGHQLVIGHHNKRETNLCSIPGLTVHGEREGVENEEELLISIVRHHLPHWIQNVPQFIKNEEVSTREPKSTNGG